MSAAVQEEMRASGGRAREAIARPEPNFFIIGAAKAGTTSLTEHLRQHPDIFMPGGDLSRKEPAHFCDPMPPWNEQYRDFNNYLALFAEAGDRQAIGEATVGYLSSPGADARIYARYPGARIIIALRNPVDRAYSWYNYMCQYGIESAPTFEQALAEGQERVATIALRRASWFADAATQYFWYGLVADDLEAYMRRFPREQIHVLLFEDLLKRPRETTRAVFEFLGVDPGFTPSFDVHNQTWVPASVRLQHLLARQWHSHPMLPRRPPRRFVDGYLIPFIGNTNALLGTLRKRKFNPATRRELLNRYHSDIRRTEELIGRSLAAWLP